MLREKFLAADVGITGANLLIAETGSSVIVTNEGNGDLTQTLPKRAYRHRLDREDRADAGRCLHDLAAAGALRHRPGDHHLHHLRHGTAREGDPDGPRAYHVVLLDNGRSEMLGGDFQDMLRCIRCGACLNHCPVYGAIGGHAYGSLYPGPMGAVLTPALYGIDHARDLPNASSFCGRCEEVCPMAIPLPSHDAQMAGARFRARRSSVRAAACASKLWAYAAKRPRLYHALGGDDRAAAGAARRKPGTFQRAPLRRRLDGHPRSAGAARQDVP